MLHMHERAGIDPPRWGGLSPGRALKNFVCPPFLTARTTAGRAQSQCANVFSRKATTRISRRRFLADVRQPWNRRAFSNRLRKKEMGCSGRGALAGCSGRALCFHRRGFFGLEGALVKCSGGCSGGVLCLQGCSGGALCLLWRPPHGFN